jgi:hypothetical protein
VDAAEIVVFASGGGRPPCHCLLGGGRASSARPRRCVPPPRARTRAFPARSRPSLLLIPAVATLSGAAMDAARSTSGLGSTTRMVGATADATAAVSGLAAARRPPFAALSAACQKRHPTTRASSGRLVPWATPGRLPAARGWVGGGSGSCRGRPAACGRLGRSRTWSTACSGGRYRFIFAVIVVICIVTVTAIDNSLRGVFSMLCALCGVQKTAY